MNKKGQLIFDAGDLIFSVVILVVVLFFLGFYVGLQKDAVKEKAEEKTTILSQDRFVLDYLMMPVSDTTYVREKRYSGLQEKEIETMKEQKMIIADLFLIIGNEPEYSQRRALADIYAIGESRQRTFELLRSITGAEQSLAFYDIIALYPSGKQDIIRSGGCSMGIISTAYIPMENGKSMAVQIKKCNK
ncbi:hypothetical protein JXB27_00880 [Candidatus Woesearchaeota archaeon]|nr:hypothetical protein [Candidatus Woesearchaeota archaeon]